MKKISLKTLDNLGIERMSREDLKMVQGGNTCGPGEFQCGNGMCIDASMQMDGIIDCPDASDEGGSGGSGGVGFCRYTCSIISNGSPLVWDADYPNLVCTDRDDCPVKACSSNLGYIVKRSCISRSS